MEQDLQVQDALVKVALKGSMYALDAANLREGAMKLIKKGKNQFRIDLSEVEYMDSTGLGLFIFLDDELKNRGGRLIIKGLTGRVKVLFERTRLYDTFVIE
jgi:anti-sigma B factor antagonist